MKIAIDAMGGECAPQAIVEGAVQAAEHIKAGLILVGKEDEIGRELAKYKGFRNISIHPASQVVEMSDSPTEVLRKKKDSSIAVAVKLAQDGKVSAIISAGNTGAAVAASVLSLRSLKGVQRPAIAIPLPTMKGTSVLLDVGANVDSKPKHLFQFGVMGNVYASYILKKRTPRVALLSIGEEETKGNDLTKAAFKLFKDSSMNFIGNIEGRDLFQGKADVIVCDGFVGNIVLKVSESLEQTFKELLKKEISKELVTKIGAYLMGSAFKGLKKKTDYSEYGGAPLLGINGVCIISHGSSSAKAIKNAIFVAEKFIDYEVNKHIVENIALYS